MGELNTVEKAMLLSRGPYSLYGYYFTGYKMASYEALIPDNSNPGFNQTIQVYLPISDTGYVMPDDMWANGTQWASTKECVHGFMYGGVRTWIVHLICSPSFARFLSENLELTTSLLKKEQPISLTLKTPLTRLSI